MGTCPEEAADSVGAARKPTAGSTCQEAAPAGEGSVTRTPQSTSARPVLAPQIKESSVSSVFSSSSSGFRARVAEESRARGGGELTEDMATVEGAAAGTMTMVVGVDESDHSYYALQWALQHFFPPGQPHQYRLVVVTAKPTAASAVGLAGPGAADVLPIVEADLKKSAMRVVEKAKELCAQVTDAVFEVVEGDARNVLCEAVERHHAEMLVVGSHGYGAIKRAVLGSVSDYCAHHAHCTVMIVKKPKHKH